MPDISQINLPDGNTYDLRDSNATDTKVTQTEASSSIFHEILLSGSSGATTKTEGSYKSAKLTFNPYAVLPMTGQQYCQLSLNGKIILSATDDIESGSIQCGSITCGGQSLPYTYNASSGSPEVVVGYLDTGTIDKKPVYEKTVILSSTVTAAAGNSSAAGAWTVLQTGWTDAIVPIGFWAWSSGNNPSLWSHLTVQWERSNTRLRVLNIRSTAADIDGFTIRYYKESTT